MIGADARIRHGLTLRPAEKMDWRGHLPFDAIVFDHGTVLDYNVFNLSTGWDA